MSCVTLTVAGSINANSPINAASSIYLTAGNVYFDNGYGLRFKDINGEYQLAAYMSNRILFANTAYPVQIYGSTTYLGSGSYPTVIDGSTIKAQRLIQNGITSIACTNGMVTSTNIVFPQAFPAVPTVVVSVIDSSGYVDFVSAYTITRSGFTIVIRTGANGNFNVHWIAVYQPTS